MNYYFCLVSGDVLTNFTNIVVLIPCTAEDSLDSIFISLSYEAPIFLTPLTGEILIFPTLIELVFTLSNDA